MKVTRREVLFRGSVEDAVALLGSESEGPSFSLAGSWCITEGVTAPVIAAIKADLLLVERKGGFADYTLTTLLPRLDTGTNKEAVHELVEVWLAPGEETAGAPAVEQPRGHLLPARAPAR